MPCCGCTYHSARPGTAERPRAIGEGSVRYGTLSRLLGPEPMPRASRREDRKRVPLYSSRLLRCGNTGIFREAWAGIRARRLVEVIPTLRPGETFGGDPREERDTPDRVGRSRGAAEARFQGVKRRDRTTK
ncbi:hypothetical protein GCM10010417_36260 [Streptomyces carpaticus]